MAALFQPVPALNRDSEPGRGRPRPGARALQVLPGPWLRNQKPRSFEKPSIDARPAMSEPRDRDDIPTSDDVLGRADALLNRHRVAAVSYTHLRAHETP